MPIEVTARHHSATAELQEYARVRAEELLEEFPRAENIHVILNLERHLALAEVVVQAKAHKHIESVGSSDKMKASIDLAMDKAEKQLRKIREKVVDHKPRMKKAEAARRGRAKDSP